MTTTLDFTAIAEQADLPAIMSRAGREVRNGKTFCTFHVNENTPAMTVFQIGGRWRYSCKKCGAKGDAIAWVANWEKIGARDAACKLAGIDPADLGKKSDTDYSPSWRTMPDPAPRPRPEVPDPWADPEWQAAVDGIVNLAESRLWSSAGREALDWLRGRGLLDHTIRRFRLGFLPSWERTEPIGCLSQDGKPRGISAPRGITLPWCHPEAWYHSNEVPASPRWVGCNVRRLMADISAPLGASQEKCMAVAGSKRGYPYPFADLAPGVPAIITEGEWDGLIAWQELGWVANTIGVGGARQDPRPSAIETLDSCPVWLLALHNDEAGNDGAKKWSTRSRGKSIRLSLPPGLDLNDMHLRDGDLLGWLRSEYESLGMEWTFDR